jgi:hypothetical protein
MKQREGAMSFFELRDALAEPGCALCRLRVRSADGFLDTLLWESVNDPARRREIREAQGFCREHGWALARATASVGVAIITRDVLQSLLKAVEDADFQANSLLSLRRVQETVDSRTPSAATAGLVADLESRAPCPARVWADKMEAIYLETLLHNLTGEDSLQADYEASEGLCLPHFRQALARVRKEAVYDALVSAQRVTWERLVAQLSESIRKSDYRHLDEVWGDEAGAWLRGIAALVGARPDDRGRRDRGAAWSFRRPAQDSAQVDTSGK